MFTSNQILIVFICFVISICVLKLENKFEILFRKQNNVDDIAFEEKKSLIYFKYSIWNLCFLGSMELSLNKFEFSIISIISIILIIFGVYLRILAIKELGKYWSFNIKIFKNHKINDNSIYRYLKHPAYIGNIYIVGFFLFFKCYLTALLTLFLIIIFGYWRSKKENLLLKYFRKYKISYEN